MLEDFHGHDFGGMLHVQDAIIGDSFAGSHTNADKDHVDAGSYSFVVQIVVVHNNSWETEANESFVPSPFDEAVFL